MRRLLPALLVALVVAAIPATSSSQVFSVVRGGGQQALPSYTVPNGPGSIRVPADMSQAPARPEVRSYEQLLALWRRAGEGYGVPWQVLAAINKIESNFGQNMGPSSAGALGWMQFIPSSWMRWGMDGDGNGIADPWNPEDGVYAAARYLAAAGAHDDLERAIFAYNHAQWYVDDVLELAATFGDDAFALGSPSMLSSLAGSAGVDQARRRLAGLNGQIERVDAKLDELSWQRLEVEQKAGDPNLSLKQFTKLDAALRRISDAEEAARARREHLEAEVDDATAALAALEQQTAMVGSGLAIAGGAQPAIDGFVFPVGGGPDIVSVGHDHHDYPAADIAAPQGTPLYALADSTVVDAYPEGDGRCGIGFTLRLDDGRNVVYCHLSYLEPHVVPGAGLAAGAPVGRVGSTGNSTGPHLHLAFLPTTSYPQDEPWFQAYAGVAFRWKDAPTPERTVFSPSPGAVAPVPSSGPVYRVIRTRVIGFTANSTG
jgi:murein DD-endopeptidase MepM/ murein hydrolase activator NlpD